MRNSFTLRRGDFWRICDRSGRKIPASKTRREWTGQIVDARLYERRHPQDFVKVRPEKHGVPHPRLPDVNRFVGPLRTALTAAAAAGAQMMEVENTARFLAGDKIEIALDTGDFWRVQLGSVVDGRRLMLTIPLPHAASTGALIVNVTANSIPDIG